MGKLAHPFLRVGLQAVRGTDDEWWSGILVVIGCDTGLFAHLGDLFFVRAALLASASPSHKAPILLTLALMLEE